MEANIVTAAFLFGGNGVVVDKVSQAQRLRARKSVFEGFLADGITQTLELPIAKPGAYLYNSGPSPAHPNGDSSPSAPSTSPSASPLAATMKIR